jgi:light-regulated signal transduction histidine kinase (bacteriophytochrome)
MLASTKDLEGISARLAELERENAALKGFAWAASHDLKEPLRGIIMHLELLAHSLDGNLEHPHKEHLQFALASAHLMASVLPAVEAFVRVRTEPLELSEVDCAAVVNRAMLLLRCAIEESDGSVTCTELPRVYSCETLLTHVFLNLIENAIRYRSEDPPDVKINCERDGAQWIFSITDNGSGIDSEYLEYVFEPFRRLHSRRKSGSGIGLALCRSAVERLGGRIWAEAVQSGGGSVFRFTLPAET